MEIIQKEINELKKLLEESKLQCKEFLTLRECAKHLSVSESYLHKLTSKNEIPFYKPSGKNNLFQKN